MPHRRHIRFIMKTKLFQHEFESLLEALQRDLRMQEDLADSNKQWAEWHLYNARKVKHLLDVLVTNHDVL
jgi:hypothetical protein